MDEKDAINWAIHTMIHIYPRWAEEDLDNTSPKRMPLPAGSFAKTAIARLEGVRSYLRRNELEGMETDLNHAIFLIRNSLPPAEIERNKNYLVMRKV